MSDGILLVNLGTPAAPTPRAVRRFLAEFLSDPRVVRLPRWVWFPVLHGMVLPIRASKSAAKYALIWTPEGSPLAVHTARQARLLKERTGMPVEYAMRYGEPSIASALERLEGCGRIAALPLFPQYSESVTGSVVQRLPASIRSIQSFHDHPAYIEALAANVRRHWNANGRSPLLLMSFHGLPRRSAGLYEEHCRATSRLLAKELELKDGEWQVTFQSRFGFAEWLRPYTDARLIQLARQGVGRIDVVCPGFVSDCLETLEEIGIAARARFLAAGGKELRLLACLNESPEWIAALAAILFVQRGDNSR